MAHNSYVLSTNEEQIAKIYFSIFASSLENANYNYLYDKCNNQLNVLKLHEDEIIDNIDNIDSYVNYTSYDYNSNIDSLYDDEAKQLNELVTNLYSEISTYKDANDIINQTLRVINNYYSSYRTSVFILSSDKLNVTLCNEYTLGDIVSFDSVKFNIDEIPGFAYIADRQEPIVIKTNYSQDEIVANYYKNLRQSNINLFYAMPLVEKNETIGFLTVSNATDYLGELTL
jgi:transcriptional regulator with GAF, ATPase, and Fis domain